jgi:hypothetical protein
MMASPRDLNHDVPVGLSNLVMESIATSPAKRPEGMGEVINRLELAMHVLERLGEMPFEDRNKSLGLAAPDKKRRPASPLAI